MVLVDRGVWGQARAGGGHSVAVEARPVGGPYRVIATLETDALGFFSARVREPAWARYGP